MANNFVNNIKKIISRNRLMLVQSIEVTALMSAGDLITQTIIDGKSLNEINFKRTIKFGSLGAFIVGPSTSAWYKFLARTVNAKDPYAPIKKMLIDQLIFAPGMLPIVMTAVEMYVNSFTWEHTKQQIRDKYFDILITNYQVWPLVQFVNFKFMPLRYQVLLAQTVGLFWNSYLSWKTVSKV
ncbi:mpv17-like protein [Diorhabda sublineata]|uniref:mpv17-like protein n=1 Tax=Diorhabda sublineata TaxID=1163346 RepID=UPI0024E0D14F|nr:mpv17-like protein [Diorhabda sublineata]